MIHLLRVVWDDMNIPTTHHDFYHLDWKNQISVNISHHGVSWKSFNWHESFIFICWFIWKWRNKGIFDPLFKSPTHPFQIILQYTNEWFTIIAKPANCEGQQATLFHWIKPLTGYFKLNVNGARSALGISGAGSVLSNWSGDWIQGFSHHIGDGEVLKAEVWGIFVGIKMVVDLHVRNLIIESDSAIAVNLLNSSCYDLHPLATIVGNCHALMQLFASCSIQHVLREQNTVADLLAKDSINLFVGTVFFNSPCSCFSCCL